MKNFSLLTVFVLVTLSLGFYGTGNGQTIIYEDFNYAVPAYIGGNGGFGSYSNNWTTHLVTTGQTTTVDILAGNLSYAGLAASSGNKVYLFSNVFVTSRDVNRAFTSTATVLYFSALINVVDASQIPSAPADYFMHFGATSGSGITVYGGRLGIKKVNSAANYRLSILNTSGGSPVYTDFPLDLNFGTTYLAVVKYDRSTSPTTASLWVNPSSLGGAEPTGQVTNATGNSSFATFASICLRNSTQTPKAEIDEIRVGLSWADVTPTNSISAPTIQTSNLFFSNVLQTQMNVLWANGNGGYRVVKINTANTFTAPVDGSAPSGNTIYSGAGEQVIYNGPSNTIPVVTGLTMGTTYWFQAWEYNGTGSGTLYCNLSGSNNPLSQMTSANTTTPSIYLPSATSIGQSSAILGGTITGDGGATITERGTVWKTSAGVDITDNKLAEGGTSVAAFSHTRSALPPKTQIFYKAYATNSVGTSLTSDSSFFTLADEPTAHAGNFAANANSTSEINLTWMPATGADGYLVLKKQGSSAPTGTPSDATGYAAGNVIGDASVAAIVISGTQTSQSISSLVSATQYYFTIIPYAYDGDNSQTYNYLITNPIPSVTATTQTPPSTVYTWIGTDNAFWITPTNWNPTRTTPEIKDILQFDGGGSIIVTDVPNQTIAQLLISNSTSIELRSTAASILNLTGEAGVDFTIPVGSALTLSQPVSGITIALSAGTTGTVGGSITFGATAHRLTGLDASAITFQNGATFTANADFSGNAFGSSVVNTNSVVFANGSKYICYGGANPFALTAPASVVVWQTGSTFILKTSGSPSLGNRTYANFELDQVTGGNFTSSSPLTMDNLSVKSGSWGLGVIAALTIKGNVSIAPGATLNFNPSTTGTIVFGGTSLQSITNAGILTLGAGATMVVNNTSGVSLANDITVSNLTFQNGLITTGVNTLSLASGGLVTGAGTGKYVFGNLLLNIPTGAGTINFDFGDATRYTPVTIALIGVVDGGTIAGHTTAGDHPDISHSGLNVNKSVNHYWSFTATGIKGYTYDATFNFVASDIDHGANTSNFLIKKFDGSLWSATTTGILTGTSSQATGLTSFSDFQIGELFSPFIVTGMSTNLSCNGSNDGAINTFLTGGVMPYTYIWNNAETTPSLNGLAAGQYEVTVTDADNTTATGSWTITQPSVVTFAVTVSNVTCFGGNNGSVTGSTTGGTPPYTYLWGDGARTESISNLPAGSYSCQVFDANNCPGFAGVMVSQPAEILLSPTITAASCPTGNDGSIDLTVSGGMTGYTYLWSTGAATQNITGLVPGDYTVTVTDGNFCTKTGSWAVGQTSDVCANISVAGEVSTTVCYNATSTITVAANAPYMVIAGGHAEMIAGEKIIYKPGTTVMLNGYMWGHIAPGGPWCGTKAVSIVTAPTGTEEVPNYIEQRFFKVYPNPTTGVFTLEFTREKPVGDVKVEVFGMQGEKVVNTVIPGEQKHTLSIEGKPTGIYFIRVFYGDKLGTQKIIKQ